MRRLLLVAILAILGASAARAADMPPAKPRMSEAAEMVWAILKGSNMGPGDGWFHPGQSRYDWKWLAERLDKDKNGRITRDEFPGNDARFARLDRNKDGVITAEDLDWSDRSPLARQSMIPGFWFRMYDQDGNGKLSAKEWEAIFLHASKGKGFLTVDDLRDALPTSPPPRPATPPPAATATRPSDAPTTRILLKGLLEGEIGSFNEGPQLNDVAPPFTLKSYDGQREVALADARGKKPVVLIFGSFT